jgi:hypothetical protein
MNWQMILPLNRTTYIHLISPSNLSKRGKHRSLSTQFGSQSKSRKQSCFDSSFRSSCLCLGACGRDNVPRAVPSRLRRMGVEPCPYVASSCYVIKNARWFASFQDPAWMANDELRASCFAYRVMVKSVWCIKRGSRR